MNTDNHFADKVEFKEVRAKVVESVGHVLVLADGGARFFRTTMILALRSSMSIYSDDPPPLAPAHMTKTGSQEIKNHHYRSTYWISEPGSLLYEKNGLLCRPTLIHAPQTPQLLHALL